MGYLTWKQFKELVAPVLPNHPRYSYVTNGVSRPLFRGHRDHQWKLQTTLERSGVSEVTLLEYMRDCSSARSFMGSLMPCDIPFDVNVSTKHGTIHSGIPNYEYLAFLRHHGFPSPLLDWSASPYVAAFFAFRHKSTAEAVRVFQFRAHLGHGRGGWTKCPQLHELGPFATVHERHAMQQCGYTISLKEDDNSEAVICTHEAALAESRSASGRQDEIFIYDIAASERNIALADLFSMNVTPYTLFRGQDALVETAAFRVLGDAG